MALNQFGAIISFAIERENALAQLYQKAAAAGGPHSAELASRAEGASKRAAKLEQTRRQNVTEITLEPIEGLRAEDYPFQDSDLSPQALDALEASFQQFYNDIMPKINVRETVSVLQRCLKEHQRLSRLSE